MIALPLMLAVALLAPRPEVHVREQVSSSAPVQRDSTCEWMSAGQQAFERGQFREAAELFARAEKGVGGERQSCAAEAAYLQARSLERVEMFGAAESAVRAYLSRNPLSAPALFLLGTVLQREDKPKESLETFTRAATLQRPTPEQLRIVGLDYVLLDDYVDAVHWLRQAVAGDPGNSLAWYDLGRAEMHEGDFIHAEKHFKQSLALDPRSVKALDNLGLSYEAQNRMEEAIGAYEKAIALQAGAPKPSEQPLLNLGTLLNTRNRASEAVPLLARSIAIAPRCSHCVEELSRAYRFTGQETLALGTMEQAIALDGSNPRLHFQLGQMYRHAGRNLEANREFKISSQLYGQHSTPER